MQSTHKQEPKLGIRVLARMTGWFMMAAVLACNSDSNTAVNALNRVAIIAVSLSSARLTIGQQVQGNVTLKNSSGVALNGKHVKWTSSNASVASVDANSGMIRALSAGSSTITAAADGAAGSENVDVVPGTSVAAVAVSLPAPTLAVGATMQATAVVADSAANPISGKAVTWASTNTSVATVDAGTGVVTGVSLGSATISATSDGVYGSSDLAVTQDGSDGTVATLTIALGTTSIAAGTTTQATAALHDAAGTVLTGLAVSWGSSNAAVARISSAGVITGLSAGTATISASSNGVAGTTTIAVTPAVGPAPIATLSVTLSAGSIATGATTQATASARDASGNVLTGRVLAWTTSNPAIATVDGSTGLVTGNAAGTVLITATSEGQTGNATLQVTGSTAPTSAPVATVSVALAAQSVVAGGSTQAVATTKDAGGNILVGRIVTWSSSDPTIAAVSSTGAISAVAAGTVTITATSEGITGVATLVVTRVPVNTVTVALGSTSIAVGATTQATATARDAGGNVLTGRVVMWSSSNVAVARVSTSGVVTGVAAGSATITANSEGQTGTASVTVTQVPVATVGVSLGATSIVVGTTTPASAVTRDAGGHLLTGRIVAWSSSNTGVASVSSGGVVTGVAVGSATITATSEGKTGSATVTVTAVPPAPVATVTVVLGASSIVAGTTTTATATTTDASGNVLTGRVIAWSSSNTAIATVTSGGGVVTGVAAGTVTITATSEGKTGSKSLTVTASAPAVATQLVIAQQPSVLSQTGILLSQQPAVQLESATGAKVSQSGVVVTAAVGSGIAVLGGTLTATTNASGVATFTNLLLTGIATSTLTFTSPGLTGATSGSISVTAATGFLAANVLSNASFETDWNGFTNWSGSGTPTGVSRDNSQASSGSWSILRSWTPNPSADGGSQLLYHVGAADHVWIRFYVKLTAPITTVMKFARFYDTSFGTSYGGFYLGSGNEIFTFGTDEENANVSTPIGLTQAQVIDGQWHCLEMDYWRNGDPSGYPSAAFWFDGNQVSMPDGTPVKYAGTTNASYWQGGRLYSGQRLSSSQMGYIEWLATLNAGNTTTGQVNIDNVAMSTAGRIGP